MNDKCKINDWMWPVNKQSRYLAPRPVAPALNLAEAGLVLWFCSVAPVYVAAQKVEEHWWHLCACRFRTSCLNQQDSPVGDLTQSTRYNWPWKIQTTSYRVNTTVLWVRILCFAKGIRVSHWSGNHGILSEYKFSTSLQCTARLSHF
jgi:hypothetical protein